MSILALLFQIVKQILETLWYTFFMRGGFCLLNGTSPRDTQLPFDMLFITMLHVYTCHVTEVVKKIKVLYRNAMKDIQISLNKILYTYTAQQIWCFLYSINANFFYLLFILTKQ